MLIFALITDPSALCGLPNPRSGMGSVLTYNMKIIFLDIDGVVNCSSTAQRHRGAIGIDPYMAFLVARIAERTNAEIVLSSTWRLWPDSREEVTQQVGRFIDVTPKLQTGRGAEIQAWLDGHPEVTRYAILDDDTDILPSQQDNWFRTYWEKGITRDIADAVVLHLNEE